MAELLSSSSDEDGASSPPQQQQPFSSSFTAECSDSQDGELLEAMLAPATPHSNYARSSSSATTTPKKPVVSAREMLLQLLPGAARHALTPPPSRASASGGRLALPRSAAAAHELSTSERIARKYGLLRTPSTGERNTTADAVDEPTKRQTIAQNVTVATPTAAAARPTPTPTKRPVAQSTAKGTATAPPAYVSPFARDGGLLDVKRRWRQAGGASAASNTRTENDDTTDRTSRVSSLNRPHPHHMAGSSIESDDGWLSDAKDVTDEPQPARARATALSLHTVPSRSLKRPRRQLSDADADELDDAERWPRLPPPQTDQGPLVLRSDESSATVCANINSYLFDYQREGAQFLFRAYARNASAILGDEMGLGKTIQVVAFLAAVLGKHGDVRDRESWRALRRRRREALATELPSGCATVYDAVPGPGPLLVVVPASLLHNWEAELRTWLCCCTVLLHGKPTEREAIVTQIPRGEYEIVICSYDILKTTIKQLNAAPWEAVVFDEIHCSKNPESQLTQAVQTLACPRKLGLTGTLMQNNEKELHCLLDTVAPGVLGSWSEFRAYYGDDIKYARKKSAAASTVARSRRKEKQLRQVLAPFYLRREKAVNPLFQEISKTDHVVFCDLTPLQLAAYERVLAMPEFELLRHGDDVCDCGRPSRRPRRECCYTTPQALVDSRDTGTRALLWERFHPDGVACRQCPNCVGLVCVAQLLKLANHMELLKVNPRDPPERQELGAAFAAQAFGPDVTAVGGVEQVTSYHAMRALGSQTCGKMRVLEQLLARWKARRQKTLLFSRSTRMLDILQLFLVSKAIAYSRLDGHTKVDDRLRLVNAFNSDASPASVFLISTRAGGLGLNLPSASNVVIFDPSWNPAHDCQAQDRAYRIGQTQDVHVYRLITLGTIEEMIYVRQIYKQQLSDTTLKGAQAPRYFDGVQGDRQQQGELFGIRNLLCYKAGGILRGVQDAYARGPDGLVVQENQVDYAKAASGRDDTRTTTAKKPKVSSRQAEEEMLEVADELVRHIVSPDDSEDDGVGRPTGDSDSDRGSDVEESEGQLLRDGGARAFLHEAIVGEHHVPPHAPVSSDSEVAEGDNVDLEPEDEERVQKPRKALRTAPRRQAALAGKKRPTALVPTPPPQRLYLPKYL